MYRGAKNYYDYDSNYNFCHSAWYILMTSDRKISVAHITEHNLYDFDKKRFLLGEDGQIMEFSSEEDAVSYLNENYKPEFIDDEYVTPNNQELFRNARK